MGYYRPRPNEVKVCVNCGLNFETNHKRAIYCGASCRVLAYKGRHGHKSLKTRSAKGDLNFSFQNVGTVAAGTGVTALTNYWLHDGPAHRQVIAELTTIKQAQAVLDKKLQQLTDSQRRVNTYIDVQISQNPKLKAVFVLAVARQNLQLAQDRGDVAKIEEFTRQVQAAQQKLLQPGR